MRVLPASQYGSVASLSATDVAQPSFRVLAFDDSRSPSSASSVDNPAGSSEY